MTSKSPEGDVAERYTRSKHISPLPWALNKHESADKHVSDVYIGNRSRI